MCAGCPRVSVPVCDLPAGRRACAVFVRCFIVVGGVANVYYPMLVRRAHLRVYEVAAPATASPPSRCGVASRWCGGMAAAAAASCCARGNVPSGLNNSRASASCAPAGTPAFACLCVSPSRGGVSGRGACDGGRAIDCVRARPPLTWNNRWRALAGERCARLNCPACSLRGNAIIARARTRTQHVPARLRTLKFNFPSWPPIRLRNVATRCS